MNGDDNQGNHRNHCKLFRERVRDLDETKYVVAARGFPKKKEKSDEKEKSVKRCFSIQLEDRANEEDCAPHPLGSECHARDSTTFDLLKNVAQ